MSASPVNARTKPKTWADLFRKSETNPTTTQNMKKTNNDNTTVNNPTTLYNQVETIQESAAVIIPGAGKTVKTIHHCFSDLSREKVIGVHGLRPYSPFKEAAADHIVAPFQPPTTRESANNKSPSFYDFVQLGKEEGIANVTCSSDKPLDQLIAKAATVWVSGDHLQRFYGKAKKANDVATSILQEIPTEMSNEIYSEKADEFYDQLLFLWCVEKGYASSVTLKDPPDTDSIQETIEEINGLLTKGWEQKDPLGKSKSPPDGNKSDKGETEIGHRGHKDPERGHDRGRRSRTPDRARNRYNPDDLGHYDDRGQRSNRSRSPRHRGSSRSRSRGRDRSRSARRDQHTNLRRGGRDQDRRSDYPRRWSPPHRSSSRDREDGEPHSQILRDPAVSALIQGMTALTKSQLEIAERDRRKKSVLSRLSQRQVFLFDALSARSWSDYNPVKTREAELMLEDRDVERNWNLMVDMTEKWPGSISKPAFIQFLTKGFVSQDRPGGFTVFMFGPPKTTTIGKKDRKRNLRNVLGKQGDFDEDDLEFYAKNEFYLPKSVYEAEGQILMAVRTLDLFTHHKSIASDGYRYGLEFLDERRSIFHERQEKDEMFMARYLALLDTAFQNFASKLGTYHEYRDPIDAARDQLRKRMEKDIERIMRDIDYDVFPRLSLPPRLTEQDPSGTGSKKLKTKDRPQPGNNRNSDEPDPAEAPLWWKKNPTPETEWAIPAGKSFRDFFDTTTATGRANLARMPKAKHHSNKVRLRRNICARYQCEGECKASCNLAHTPPSKMSDDITQEVREAFRIAYNS